MENNTTINYICENLKCSEEVANEIIKIYPDVNRQCRLVLGMQGNGIALAGELPQVIIEFKPLTTDDNYLVGYLKRDECLFVKNIKIWPPNHIF